MAVDNNLKVGPRQLQGQKVNTPVDDLVHLLNSRGTRESKAHALNNAVTFLKSPAARSFTPAKLSPLVQAIADELSVQNRGPVAWRTGENGLGGWTPSPDGPTKPYFQGLASQNRPQLERAAADALKFLTTPQARAVPRQTIDQLLTAVAEAQLALSSR